MAQSSEMPDDNKKSVSVEFIVDASGSMAALTSDGQIRMDAAKAVLKEVIAAIPEADGINVGFRVYGHRGNNQDDGRAESCVSTELLVPVQGLDKQALNAQVDQLQPVGWTPLALALQEAEADFPTPSSDTESG